MICGEGDEVDYVVGFVCNPNTAVPGNLLNKSPEDSPRWKGGHINRLYVQSSRSSGQLLQLGQPPRRNGSRRSHCFHNEQSLLLLLPMGVWLWRQFVVRHAAPAECRTPLRLRLRGSLRACGWGRERVGRALALGAVLGVGALLLQARPFAPESSCVHPSRCRSKFMTTASAVKGVPSWNVTSCRSLKVHSSPSPETAHSFAK